MTILENIQQLLRHLTTEQELKEVKKMVALLEMELNGKTIKSKKLGFKNCFNCGSLTHFKEKRYYQIKGFFVGHILCLHCWKGRNDKR